MLRAGIDEAGRGPLVGPLVAALVVLDAQREALLREAGVTDSKKLSPKRREALADLIARHALHVGIVAAEPERIDAALLSPVSNLNLLEAELTAELITGLPSGSAIVAIDLPTRNEASYRAAILSRCSIDPNVTLILEHKADVNHTACAAASIIAKVERDRTMRALEAQIGIPIGSGYPSDPATRAFLEAHGRSHAALFRRTWSSYTDRYPASDQRTLV